MNENKPADDAHAQRRRRVLRGALSAPVVLTISSGAGAQMTSNLRCVANQVATPANNLRTAPVVTAPTATYVNVRLFTSNGLFYISGSGIRNFQHPSRPISWIADGQWRQFDPATNALVGGNVIPSPTPVLVSPERRAAVQIDQAGYIRSVGVNSGTTTSMIAGTCWNSFRAGP